MAASIAGMSDEDWQEWMAVWTRRLLAAEGDYWESCAMHWYPDREDDDRPAP